MNTEYKTNENLAGVISQNHCGELACSPDIGSSTSRSEDKVNDDRYKVSL
jgi:hypothetical protein